MDHLQLSLDRRPADQAGQITKRGALLRTLEYGLLTDPAALHGGVPFLFF